jgi:hypothetical protein
MATQRYYSCRCGKQRSRALFDALREFQSNGSSVCDSCDEKKKLHLIFPFGLGAAASHCTVEAVFLPHRLERWMHKKQKVTFFPFLVILNKAGSAACWLPYWHVEGQKKKYGQWAPYMGMALFRDLLAQARKAGYLH